MEVELLGMFTKFVAGEHQAFLAWYMGSYASWHCFLPPKTSGIINELADDNHLKKGVLVCPEVHALLLNLPLWVRKGMGVYYQHSPSLLSTAQFRCFDPEVVAAYH